MATNDLIEYIEQNHLEYQMVNILLYNHYGFSFLPVPEPQLIINSTNESFEVIGFGGINLLANGYRVPVFKLTDELKRFKYLNRARYHPEEIRAYIARSGSSIGIEMVFSRKRDRARLIRNAAFETFANWNKVETIEQFNLLYTESVTLYESRSRLGETPRFDYEKLLIDEAFSISANLAGIETERLYNTYRIKLAQAEKEIFNNRFALTGFHIDISESLGFLAVFEPIKPIKTSLEKPIVIIHDEDEIPNILYHIAFNLQATRMFIAVGYTYESGLDKLLPAIDSLNNNEGQMFELIVGDLSQYVKGKRCKSPNRATASLLNNLLKSKAISKLYTHPERFYHGKYYYIGNESTSYVIMGSSNVTLPAYQKNKELDVLYRFDRTKGTDPLEQEFLDWYEALKADCIELDELHEDMFPSNLDIDEEGNSYSNSLIRKITSEEEQDRFRYLESFSPSSIKDDVFSGKYYKPFRDYMLFVFPEKDISILEGFSYGNSCYIFGTTEVDRIKYQLSMKSKEQVRQADIFITSIPHDERYKQEIEQFMRTREK